MFRLKESLFLYSKILLLYQNYKLNKKYKVNLSNSRPWDKGPNFGPSHPSSSKANFPLSQESMAFITGVKHRVWAAHAQKSWTLGWFSGKCLWEKARVGWFERVALKHVYYHMWNELPVQVRCMRQGAQGWCTGMTLRYGVGREVEGGFWIGNTCVPVADSCQCMAKTTTIL